MLVIDFYAYSSTPLTVFVTFLWLIRVDENTDKLNDIITKKSYLTSTPKLSAPPPDQLTTLNKIQDMLFVVINSDYLFY